MELMVNGTLPVFVNVTICGALVVARGWLANVKLVGDKVTAGPIPVPVKVMPRGLPGALSRTVILPGRIPGAEGAKVTLIIQLAPHRPKGHKCCSGYNPHSRQCS